MAVRKLMLCGALLMSACAASPPVEVKIPVSQRVSPPDELVAPIVPPVGVFIAPGNPGAVACVAPAGRDALVGYVDTLRQRVAAWESWTK